MTRQRRRFAPEAYAPTGVLWWELTTHPGTKREFGDERKIAAWLAFNVREGETFTMRDLRRATATVLEQPNAAEQLNRRLRNLRPDGWLVLSYKTESGLPSDTYRLLRIGWHPALGPRPLRPARVSADAKRRVIERDGRRCVVCGVGSGEPYPAEPGTYAVMTAGHRIPNERAAKVRSLDELQAECQRCNETVRDELPDPATLAELMPDVRRLTRAEREELLAWLLAGHRLRSRLDMVHDAIRMLAPSDRELVAAELRVMLGRRGAPRPATPR